MPRRSPQPPTSEGANAQSISRRRFLKAGIGGAGLLRAATMRISAARPREAPAPHSSHHHQPHLMPTVVGEVDHTKNGFNPTEILTDFDGGNVTILPSGQTLREYTLIAQNKTIEIVPGLQLAAWTYNGRIPGP